MMTRREALAAMAKTPGVAGLAAAAVVVPVAGVKCGQDLDELKKRIENLREMKEVACAPGTVDYDPYFQGMANGVIFALSVMTDKAPQYIDPPAEWGYKRRDRRLVDKRWSKY